MSQNDTTELEPDARDATGAEGGDADPAQDTAQDTGQESLGAAPDAAPRSRRRRRIALAGVVGLGLLWSVGWHSPVTLVEHVVVNAPRGLSAESIRLASGISAADHVPAVDADAVRAGIKTAIPAVADVSVRRSLPHTIELEVTGRRPFAALAAGKGFNVMDDAGIVYDKVARAKGIPVISAATDETREIARTVLLEIPADLRKRVARVRARSRDNITFTLRSGATVRWGSVADSELKARVLAGLMEVKATRYDVSAPLLPTTFGSPEPS